VDFEGIVERVAKGFQDKRIAMSWGRTRSIPRSSYFPKDADVEEAKPKGTDLVIYKWEDNGKLFGIAFKGRANKPLWYHRFRNTRELEELAMKTIESRKNVLEEKEKRREERKNYRHDYKEGDILYSSWGYDQTNIDFYQVVGVKEKSVVLQKVGQNVVKQETGSDYVVPVENKFIESKKLTKRVNPDGYVKIDSYAGARRWDGKPKRQTAFGYGH
jgi:hypothetical protein